MITWKEAEARIAAGGSITRKELEHIIAKSGGRTAEESDRLFQGCPEWLAEQAVRNKEFEERRARYREEEKPLTNDLAAAGWTVESSWDFVNTRQPYPTAIPVLAKHMTVPYHPRIREGIIRALTVVEARGEVAQKMLAEFRHSGNESTHVRWAMANAFTVIADKSMVPELEILLAEEREETVARMLRSAVRKAKKVIL